MQNDRKTKTPKLSIETTTFCFSNGFEMYYFYSLKTMFCGKKTWNSIIYKLYVKLEISLSALYLSVILNHLTILTGRDTIFNKNAFIMPFFFKYKMSSVKIELCRDFMVTEQEH